MKKIFWLSSIGLICLSWAVWAVGFSRTVSETRVTFLDVGQGDSILIQAPGNIDVLIDGGPDNRVVEKLGERLPFFDRTIELLILTHPDSDHVNGLPEVARRYRINQVVITGVKNELPTYTAFLELLAKQKTVVQIAKPNLKFQIGQGVLTVLGPQGDHQNEVPKEANALSVVSRFELGVQSVLLTGDADEKEEAQLVAQSADLRSDILKVGHHGSKTASSEQFLKAVAPALAVLSYGADNRYGHPNQETVERIKEHGAQIFSTAETGDVCFVLGQEIKACK
jgi:competence protein ComEC